MDLLHMSGFDKWQKPKFRVYWIDGEGRAHEVFLRERCVVDKFMEELTIQNIEHGCQNLEK